MFAQLFGVHLQTFIEFINVMFINVLSIFNGLLGGLIGYTSASIIGAYTIQNNEFVRDLLHHILAVV